MCRKKTNTLIIRLPSIFAPEQRQRKLIPLLFKKYCQNGKCTVNNDDLGEYIYVEDAAQKFGIVQKVRLYDVTDTIWISK